MYGITDASDLSFLLHTQLLQVCYGQFQLALQFTETITIAIEGDYAIRVKTSAGLVTARFSAQQPYPDSINCIRLLGDVVAAVEIVNHRTLLIRFASGATLTLYDSNKDLESFQIVSQDHHIIV